MGAAYQEQAKVFKALCDPKRLAILEQLRSGEKCACVLQEPLDLTQSGLSYHMKILCDARLVTGRKEGKWVYYSLNTAQAPVLEQAVHDLFQLSAVPAEDEACHCQ